MEFRIILSKQRRVIWDYLFMTVKPFSKSVTVLTFVLEGHPSSTVAEQLPTFTAKIGSITNKIFCIRQPIARVMEENSFDVRLEANNQKPECSFGHIIVKTNLCLYQKWILDIERANSPKPINFLWFTEHNLFRSCVEGSNNLGEDYLLWKQN